MALHTVSRNQNAETLLTIKKQGIHSAEQCLRVAEKNGPSRGLLVLPFLSPRSPSRLFRLSCSCNFTRHRKMAPWEPEVKPGEGLQPKKVGDVSTTNNVVEAASYFV